jgi:hypothetical protein
MKLDAVKPVGAQQLEHSVEVMPYGSPVIERQVAMSMLAGGPPSVPPLEGSPAFESSAQPAATRGVLAIDSAKKKSLMGASYAPPRSVRRVDLGSSRRKIGPEAFL